METPTESTQTQSCFKKLYRKRWFWPVLIFLILLVAGAIVLTLYLIDRYDNIEITDADSLPGIDSIQLSQGVVQSASFSFSLLLLSQTFFANSSSTYTIILPTFNNPCSADATAVSFTFNSQDDSFVTTSYSLTDNDFVSGVTVMSNSDKVFNPQQYSTSVSITCDDTNVALESTAIKSSVSSPPRIVQTGSGNGNRDYTVSGVFNLVETAVLDPDSNYETVVLRHLVFFDDVVVSSGPDVYLYLSTVPNARDLSDPDVVLVPIDGTRDGTFSKVGTYIQELEVGSLTASADSYVTVVVWCRRFTVLFGYADLTTTTT